MKRRAIISTLILCACNDVDTSAWSRRNDSVAPGASSASSASSVSSTNAGSVASLACRALDGRYTFSYSEQDGGCGMWANDTLYFQNGRLAESSTNGCAEGQVTMTGDCELRIDSTCVATVDLGIPDLVTQYVTGTITETQDNRYATGVVQVTFVYGSGKRCMGHYQVWANRNN